MSARFRRTAATVRSMIAQPPSSPAQVRSEAVYLEFFDTHKKALADHGRTEVARKRRKMGHYGTFRHGDVIWPHGARKNATKCQLPPR